MIKKYVKKPVVIEAVQWKGDNTEEVCSFVGQPLKSFEGTENQGAVMIIPTLEGNMTATPNDYIIKGVQGEYYPCKPDIFEQTYDEVNGDEER